MPRGPACRAFPSPPGPKRRCIEKQVYYKHHGPDEEPVQKIVQQPRHGVQMVHRIDRRGVKDQVDQNGDQQEGEGLVQLRVLPARRKIDHGDKGQNEKQRDLHAQHSISPLPHYSGYSRRGKDK